MRYTRQTRREEGYLSLFNQLEGKDNNVRAKSLRGFSIAARAIKPAVYGRDKANADALYGFMSGQCNTYSQPAGLAKI